MSEAQALEILAEVRGIFAPAADHPAIKAAALKLSARPLPENLSNDLGIL